MKAEKALLSSFLKTNQFNSQQELLLSEANYYFPRPQFYHIFLLLPKTHPIGSCL